MYICMGYIMKSCFFVLICLYYWYLKVFYQMFILYYFKLFVFNVNLYELYYGVIGVIQCNFMFLILYLFIKNFLIC